MRRPKIIYLWVTLALASIVLVGLFIQHQLAPPASVLKSMAEQPARLLDLETGQLKVIVPDGYSLVDNQTYKKQSNYLILRKEDNLFLYNRQTQKINGIFNWPQHRLKPTEEAHVYQSITADNQFFIQINRYDPSPQAITTDEEQIYGGPQEPSSTRSYFYDVNARRLTKSSSIPFYYDCLKYDSIHSRFFAWRCQPVIDSRAPLTILNFNNQVIDTIIDGNASDNGEDSVKIIYDGRYFIALSADNWAAQPITVIDPIYDTPTKTSYLVDSSLSSALADRYANSAAISPENQTIAVAHDRSITLLRYDLNNLARHYQTLWEFEYLPTPFITSQSLRYQVNEGIRNVDLRSWKTGQTIPVPNNYELSLL